MLLHVSANLCWTWLGVRSASIMDHSADASRSCAGSAAGIAQLLGPHAQEHKAGGVGFQARGGVGSKAPFSSLSGGAALATRRGMLPPTGKAGLGPIKAGGSGLVAFSCNQELAKISHGWDGRDRVLKVKRFDTGDDMLLKRLHAPPGHRNEGERSKDSRECSEEEGKIRRRVPVLRAL
ncbi:hypothetical protein B0T21DRAFT_438912 [Apiosordaria backusii]|uniref:Uncharacterized protein n=1 Tax=Apiosordaria backusii TaxID=314023 RepID=A0AA40BN96_9PEZI|nr:hypothetical protein B0T21DRAFT_438912 [Apiosordaria backusii]